MKHFVFFFSILLVLGGVAANAGTVPYVPDAHTIALYHFDEASGGVTPDAVGNHPGTLQGNAAITAGGMFGKGLSLDGAGDYVRLGNVHLNPSKSIAQGTVEAWVKLSSAPDYFVVLGSGKEYGGNGDDGWFLGRHKWLSTNLVFMIWNGNWQTADSGISPESLVGSWHHLAGTWGPAGVQIWVDEVLKATAPFYGAPQNQNYATALVGTDSWTWDTPGMIDEVRISDIQRSDFQPIPIPGAVWLLGSGLLSLAGWRRFRKS